MKKLLILLVLVLSIYNCSDDDSASLVYLRAAIHNPCNNEQNFIGVDIYGYELTESGLGTYWQVGAHPAGAVNEEPDLGMNIFNPDLESGQYSIDGGSFTANSVFVYYIDANGIEYGSTTNIQGAVSITNDGKTATITVSTNVELYSFETEQTICISNFEAQVIVNE